jgi:hypothetical protein
MRFLSGVMTLAVVGSIGTSAQVRLADESDRAQGTIATLAFIVLIALPWRATYWSQENLPPTWVQPTVAALRLSVVGVALALGAAVMIFATARQSIKATAHAEK